MARRKSKKSVSRGFSLNKNHIWGIMIVLGVLYFFSRMMAKGSPVFNFFTKYSGIAFGEIWLLFFFVLAIVLGILVLVKGHLAKFLIKYYGLLLMLISAELNVRFWTVQDAINYPSNGGYFSWPLLFVLEKGLKNETGSYILAIKWIVGVLLCGAILYLLYVLNVRLPKLPRISIEQPEAPTKKDEKSDAKETSRPTITISRPDISTDSILEKVSQATGKVMEKTKTASGASWSLFKDMFRAKVEQKIEEKKPKPVIQYSGDKPTFQYSALESNLGKESRIDEAFLVEKAKDLQIKLAEFWVPITIEGFDIGPSIVQIKIKPEEWIKISAIENLQNDIKLALKTKSLSILAPIEWTDMIGIQIPNPQPNMVRLWDILSTHEFWENMKKKQTSLALWKGIDGKVQIKALDDMPHLLIAGATGSGKSVGVNDFILSLMFQNTPAELKFLMIDPKQVELEMYSGLPYLLGPIVSESGKAIKLLQWACEEMERRYSLLKDERVKNLKEYNEKMEAESKEKLYRIVFIIDEMADLMISSSANKKEAENCINRLAAKARAAGIYLILATQRPSVNVITGLIKANIPTRIAFGVVNEVDSRTILGSKGAEDLVGKGDMLYMDPNTKSPIRIQAPFVSTEEIERVVGQLKNKYMQNLTEEDIYHPEIVSALEAKVETSRWSFSGGEWGSDEELINQAIAVISETRKASATMLQRKLNIWFGRAARIMDALEERGVVWPQDWAKPREIFL